MIDAKRLRHASNDVNDSMHDRSSNKLPNATRQTLQVERNVKCRDQCNRIRLKCQGLSAAGLIVRFLVISVNF